MKKTLIIFLSLLILTLAGCSAPANQPQSDISSKELHAPSNTQEDEANTTETAQETAGTTETAQETEKENPELEKPDPVGQLKAHFIDVGQGDSILIQTPTQNILIDGGDRDYGSTVVSYIKNQGVSELNLVIGTHAHSDHIGGLIEVFKNIPVKEVIDPGVVHTSKTFEDYLTLIDQKDIKFTEGRAGMTRDIGGAKMQILHPVSPSSSHLNDSSIVAKITFGQVSFMLTGDAEQDSEAQILLQSQVQPTSTILKLGHHGSRTSTTDAFLEAVDPEVAIIMAGEGNSYGHPHEETLQKLSDTGVDIYRTDLHGTIVITTDGQTYDINAKQPYNHTPQKKPDPEPDKADEVITDSISFAGSINSDKYHFPDCRHVESIKPKNRIIFNSVEEAKSKGYSPCGACKPPN